jgi:hypothetical protein
MNFKEAFPTLHKQKLEQAIPAVGLRCNIPADFSRKPDRIFLRKLEGVSADLELVWMIRRGRWACYRVDKHTCRDQDQMYLCGILQGADGEYRDPGDWYIHALQKGSSARKYGCPTQVERQIFLEDQKEEYENNIAAEKFHQDMTDDAVNNMGMACRGRTSFSSVLSGVNNKRAKYGSRRPRSFNS